ncbi:hypothetical protein EII14_06815 [Alloprevotella sp. OH1205_COT-284]|uniref:hypothetical protein n=1 Tax=Alloprevotella sp. OH1205_COT-284 TaxID=2491043 RepID=UPI000F60422F|nr:hypothetical protein [Alloprevotella sp. OH1205_COT-284]RRD78402.1 hypothetical protein EII14_06815 [Alloprevotella sp. OH1205_COT-284]
MAGFLHNKPATLFCIPLSHFSPSNEHPAFALLKNFFNSHYATAKTAFLPLFFVFCRFAFTKTSFLLIFSAFLAKASEGKAVKGTFNRLVIRILTVKAKSTLCLHLLSPTKEEIRLFRVSEGKNPFQRHDIQMLADPSFILPSLAFTVRYMNIK